jgi:hypothetical protein
MAEKSLIPIASSAHEVPTLPFGMELLSGQLRESSRGMYARDILSYLDFAGCVEAALDAATLKRWSMRLAQKDHPAQYSPYTIDRMLSAVKRLMAEAAAQKLLAHKVADSFEARKGVKVRALKERLKPNASTYSGRYGGMDWKTWLRLQDDNQAKSSRSLRRLIVSAQ